MDSVYVNTNLTIVWEYSTENHSKGETNVPLNKIGHISENTFGKDSKTYTNDKNGPSPVLRQKNKWGYDIFPR